MSGDDKVKRLTESSLLMAVSIVLFLGAFIPLLGILVAPFCPVPLCIITSRYGMKHGLFMSFTTVLCLSLIFSVVVGAAFIPFVFTGFLLGTLGRYKGPPLRSLMYGILALQMLFMVTFYGYETVASRSENFATVRQVVEDRFDRTSKAYSHVRESLQAIASGDDSGEKDGVRRFLALILSKEDSAAFDKVLGLLSKRASGPLKEMKMFILAVMHFPFAFFFVLASIGFSLSFFVATVLSERFGFDLPLLPPFSRWQGSRLSAFIAMALLGGTVWQYNGSDTGELWLYLLNFSFVFLLYFIVLGTSLLVYLLNICGIGPVIRFFLVLLAFRYFAFWPLPALPLGALVDSLFDLRKLHDSKALNECESENS